MANPPIKQRLESSEFTADTIPASVRKRLSDCLTSDGYNIRQNSPPGKHIELIQEALKKIKKTSLPSLPDITDAAGTYGQTTADAVLAYKKENVIIRDGQDYDAIVGRMTITRLDTELKNLGTKPPAPPVPPAPAADPWIFTVPDLPLIIKEGNDSDENSDLEIRESSKTATEMAKHIIQTLNFKTITTQNCMELILRDLSGGGPLPATLAQIFFQNTVAGRKHDFPQGSAWSKRMAADSQFVRLTDDLVKAITKAIALNVDSKNKIKNIHCLKPGNQPDELNNLVFVPDWNALADPTLLANRNPLAFGFGSIQGVRISLVRFTGLPSGAYLGRLKIEILDHFGCNNTDIYSGGLAALYLLQRKLVSDQNRGAHMPYKPNVIVDVAFDQENNWTTKLDQIANVKDAKRFRHAHALV